MYIYIYNIDIYIYNICIYTYMLHVCIIYYMYTCIYNIIYV